VSFHGPNDFEIYVMNADGSGLRNLTREWGLDGLPVWSPDGQKIAFPSKRDGNGEIYLYIKDV
jgi:TolB protein